MEKIENLLKKCGTFMLATVEGDKPKLRVLGVVDHFEGKLFFYLDQEKDAYHEITKNANVEIVGLAEDCNQVHVSGKAVFDFREEVAQYLKDHHLFINKKYSQAGAPKLAPFYIEDMHAFVVKKDDTVEHILN
ncbi:hypothetical protein EIN_169030 [Entamoeba invadens IP1]|uniref:Pyridoxamine 5'-phosphate oxidase N-terminal domain-containing protein n=1 Tax=Entamoeba invadens IP1 TaxID=370355 RepID=A0A0A1U0S8_ENTIV|nr:hypothetical protein EIN_169030 [Entamoeba invadens IP1]ELP84488.1 hypothetical protein EIN_169030 [Entamoeba invadens IP1]|eukprot:XP_004183834.1 hypothetical protein EIN_169030 [Entamoeba invadens IP1]